MSYIIDNLCVYLIVTNQTWNPNVILFYSNIYIIIDAYEANLINRRFSGAPSFAEMIT
jgi:hypothetical protein